MSMAKPLVGIVMGSDSDLSVMKKAADTLSEFGIAHEVTIVSAHRTPSRLVDYAEKAAARGLKVVIAGAGGAAHLPGMVAAHCALPVIGVPVMTRSMKGLDSLLSIAQMPPGIPVATVAINGAKNAGILAAEILGASDEKLRTKVVAYKKRMEKDVLAKAKKLEKAGYKKYL